MFNILGAFLLSTSAVCVGFSAVQAETSETQMSAGDLRPMTTKEIEFATISCLNSVKKDRIDRDALQAAGWQKGLWRLALPDDASPLKLHTNRKNEAWLYVSEDNLTDKEGKLDIQCFLEANVASEDGFQTVVDHFEKRLGLAPKLTGKSTYWSLQDHLLIMKKSVNKKDSDVTVTVLPR